VAFLDEQTQRVGIFVSVARSEALVGHVEEREVALLLDNFGDLLPLLWGRVNTCGVVGAGVQQHDAVVGSGLQVCNHAIEVEADGVLVVVLVLLDLKTRVTEDSLVVGPRGRRNVDSFGMRIVSLEEGTANSQSSCARNGLCDGDAIFLDGSRVMTVSEDGSGFGEGRDTSDAWSFMSKLCRLGRWKTDNLPAYSLSRFLDRTFCSASLTDGST
jgi:hypothetical protein